VKELKGFSKVELEPAETKTLKFTLVPRAFAYYEVKLNDWYVEGGSYDIFIGASSRDIRLTESIEIADPEPIPFEVTTDTLLMDLVRKPGAAELIKPLIDAANSSLNPADKENKLGDGTNEMFENMVMGLPLHGLRSWIGDDFNDEVMWNIIDKLNKK
jgi:beta-glucosidase